MTQRYIDQKLLRTRIGVEAVAFGTAAASMLDLAVEDGANPLLDQENVQLMDGRGYAWADRPLSVAGLKKGECELQIALRCHSTALNAAAAPTETPLGTLLATILGGSSAAAGAVVDASGSTDSQIKCATVAHAARFAPGTWLSVVCAGQREVRYVTASDGAAGTIDFVPPLPSSGVPTAASEVWNSRSYFPSQFNAKSLTIEQAREDASGDHNAQVQLRGANGDLELMLEVGKPIELKSKMMAATWTGPSSSLGLLPAPRYTDPHGPAFLFGHSEVWLVKTTDFATTGTTHVPVSKVGAKFNEAKRFLPDAGGIEGKGGIERSLTEDGVYSEVELSTTAWDNAWPTSFDSGDLYTLVVVVYSGSGTTRRATVHSWLGLEFTTRPVNEFADRGMVNKLHFRTVGNRIITSGLTDLLLAPYVHSMI